MRISISHNNNILKRASAHMRALYAPIAIFLLVLAFPPACHLALHALGQAD